MKRWMMVCLVLCAGCPSDELTTCGDRVCAEGEVCLDNACTYCGNGRVDHVAGDDGQLRVDEECDVATDASCDLNCTFRRCGNGFVGVDENGAPEQCDDGNAINNDTCDNNCTAPACGNGVVAGTEECDDGTVGLSGDGCSSACVRESEYWLDGPGPLLPERAYAAVAVDTDRKRVVVFGGVAITDGGFTRVVDETWEWDGREWTELFPPGPLPPARARAMIAYDPRLHRTVMFGGTSSASPADSYGALADTWEWDGTQWTQVFPADSPSARVGGVMAYDAIGGGVIVQGGQNKTSGRSDTWRYTHDDPAHPTWSLVAPSGSGPYSYGAAATAVTAADGVSPAANGVAVVMLDGEDRSTTWIWNGTVWSVDSTEPGAADADDPPPYPSARMFSGFAFDPQRARAVLFGGRTVSSIFETDPPHELNEVWEWDATAASTGAARWSPSPSSAFPTPRHGMQFAFDPTVTLGEDRTPFVLWGGDLGALEVVGDLWTGYSSQTADVGKIKWIPMSRERLPLRIGAAAAFDALRGEVIAYGGAAGGFKSPLDGTSVWDGTRWRSLPAAKEPGPMAFAAATFARAQGRTVLFGYRAQEPGDSSQPTNTLWAFNQGAWTLRDPIGDQPVARVRHAMTYDERNDQVLVFGGKRITSPNTQGEALGDLWALGAAWTKLSDAPSGPKPRSGAAMAFDPHGHDAADPYDVLLFGGSGPLDDTWLWNGQTWTQAQPATSPPARGGHKIVYDERLDSLLLFGGSTSDEGPGVMNDLWRWDRAQATWIQIPVSNAPEPMLNHSMVYDPIRDEVVVFGGRTADNSLSSATWTFRYRSPTPLERCDGMDADGDGLDGCDDPDCRARCEPVCRANETTCDPDRPRCGDGQCSELEDHALCPVDCNYCGDGACVAPEDAMQCPVDCFVCGDGACMQPEEDSVSCPADCQ